MAQQAIGVDISGGVVRAVLVEGSTKKCTVLEIGEALIEPASADEPYTSTLARALKSAFSQLTGSKDSVAIVIDSPHCAYRELTLPFVGDEEIRKVVKFELESHLQQWNIDEVIADVYTISQTKGQSHLLVAAAPKAHLRQIFQACESAGFDPLVADLDAAALFNAAFATDTLAANASYIFIHVAGDDALILVVEGKTLKLVRSVRLTGPPAPPAAPTENTEKPGAASTEKTASAGEAKTASVLPAKSETAPAAAAPADPGVSKGVNEAASNLEVIFLALEEEAEGKVGPASEAAAKVEAPVIPAEKRKAVLIVREILRSLTAVRLQYPIEAVYVSGSWGKIQGLSEAVEWKLHQRPCPFQIFEKVEHVLRPDQVAKHSGKVAIAFGAALKLLDIDAVGINFRQEELRFTRRFEQLKKELAIAMASICVLLLVQWAFLYRTFSSSLEPSYDNLYKASQGKVAAFLGKELPVAASVPALKKISNLKAQVETEFRNLKEKTGQAADFKQPQSAFEAWRQFFAAVKVVEPKLGDYRIEKFESAYNEGHNREANVQLVVDFVFLGDQRDTSAALDELLNHLRSKGWTVNRDQSGFTALPKGGGIKSTVKVELKVNEVAG